MNDAVEKAKRIVDAADALKRARWPTLEHRELTMIWHLACVEDGTDVAREFLKLKEEGK